MLYDFIYMIYLEYTSSQRQKVERRFSGSNQREEWGVAV